MGKDLELSRKVIKDDDIVDELFEEVKTTLIDFIAENKGEQGGEAIDLIMVAKYLERIADHATNIAEWVDYLYHRNPQGFCSIKKEKEE